VAEAIIDARMPRTLEGVLALCTAICCAHEESLDDSDPVHHALKQLVCGVMMAIEGGCPPERFETFSDRG